MALSWVSGSGCTQEAVLDNRYIVAAAVGDKDLVGGLVYTYVIRAKGNKRVAITKLVFWLITETIVPAGLSGVDK